MLRYGDEGDIGGVNAGIGGAGIIVKALASSRLLKMLIMLGVEASACRFRPRFDKAKAEASCFFNDAPSKSSSCVGGAIKMPLFQHLQRLTRPVSYRSMLAYGMK